MFRKIVFIGFVLSSSMYNVLGQVNKVAGSILNLQGEPLAYATAVLLDPMDSTLVYYSITDEHGSFEIKAVDKGAYLLQVAFMGYKTMYKKINIPLNNSSPIIFAMEEKSLDLGEVEVVGEAIPLVINGDTVEYNRGAYKLSEDAVVEDLLQKLPGVEVDRAGNIKAMGEDVNKVFVDGKEFFGNDPKMATKNIPAKAVQKVQMYDKKSDESEFTGVDDGLRDKAMNLVMEEDMKDMLFGSVEGGGGNPSIYNGGAKVFYKTEKVNLAGLGMVNNTNNPGFSFGDYMSFKGGGLGWLSGGTKSISFGGDNSLPVNFGQPIYGLNKSGAGGLNFSYATSKHDRVYASYMGNTNNRDLNEQSKTLNYTSNTDFIQNRSTEENRSNSGHSLNFGLKKRIDSTANISFNGNLNLNAGQTNSYDENSSLTGGNLINSLSGNSINDNNNFGFNSNVSYLKMPNHAKTIFKLGGSLDYRSGISMYDNYNKSIFYSPYTELFQSQFQDDHSGSLNYSGYLHLTQKIASKYFLESTLRVSNTEEYLQRKQGISRDANAPIDSLSPDAEKNYLSILPSIGLRRNTDKSKFLMSLAYQGSRFISSVNNEIVRNQQMSYILPSLNYEINFTSTRRLSFNYSANVNEPVLDQLLPVSNNINPLFIVQGNPFLEPENAQQANIQFFIFDQFSFTTFFANLSGTYTKNKFSWSRNLDEKLVQTLQAVNVDYGTDFQGSFDLSRPIRKLGIRVHLNAQESVNMGIAPVNGIDNEYTGLTHEVSFSIDNRKKQKWDASTGIGFESTQSYFSIREDLNNTYADLNWFGEISYTPNEKMDFMFSADIINYDQQEFSESMLIPLLNWEMKYHFMKSNRATLSFIVHDILNRDTGIQRISELNYLREVKRNLVGRYFMLSFKFRLNKFADNSDVKLELKKSHR